MERITSSGDSIPWSGDVILNDETLQAVLNLRPEGELPISIFLIVSFCWAFQFKLDEWIIFPLTSPLIVGKLANKPTGEAGKRRYL
jgi:hypothetical protein